jgi:hypothetical protein
MQFLTYSLDWLTLLISKHCSLKVMVEVHIGEAVYMVGVCDATSPTLVLVERSR